MFERYTQTSKVALFHARASLTEHGGTRINDAHLLIGLLRAAGDQLLAGLADEQTAQQLSECLVSAIVEPELLGENVEVPFDDRTQRILSRAVTLADGLRHSDVTPRHLFLSLLRDSPGTATDCLQRAGISVDAAIAAMHQVLRGSVR